MTVVAVVNQKGGSSKTTTVLGLASAASARGIETLVIDLDPQCNASEALGIEYPLDGKTAAEWGLVNESVPLVQLKDRVTDVASKLNERNPVTIKAIKDAVRRVGDMTYDDAEDYLLRAQEAANSFDNDGRKEGIRQFIDEKSYKPGLGAYDRSRRS